jgi:fluoroacetyl-CoA thioesterase
VLDHGVQATDVPYAQLGWWVAFRSVTVATGLRGEARMVVSEADTARALRSGSVDVLGTPRLIALCEEASVAAIAPDLAPGTTTVGMKVRIDHLQPSPIGARVVAEAMVEKVEGRRITFTVSASDGRGLIAVGRVVRVIVDVNLFLAKCGA